ncbi:MAG: prepilin-type N-terminal cleavage/methylation domain-containing protein, partial [Planctomycetota bacterium]
FPNRSTIGHPPRAAFTLLEVAVVVVVLATLAAVAMPKLSNSLGRQRAALAAWSVSEDLRFTSVRARQTGLPHRFRISSSAMRVQIFMFDPGLTLVRDRFLNVEPYRISRAQAVNPDTLADQGITMINFDTYGRPQERAIIRFASMGQISVLTVDDRGRTSISNPTEGR